MNLENIITDVEQLPLSLTVSDISRILRIGKQNAYDLCHSKGFPSVQIGKRIIVPKPAFIEWLNNPNKFDKIGA
ncbi:UNVERIFIED_CONTAM: excisionase family DNA binding protein [Acetivibrio alkalicellulosi]